jgi:hypothetical protein
MRQVLAEGNLWSRKLLTLRAIQTITVLDLRTYEELIRSLGGYGEGG